MGKYFLTLPSMGESVAEATLTTWLKEVGDHVAADESIVEVATDKVDSDIPCEVSGVVVERKFNVSDVIKVGDVIAVIESEEVNTDVPLEETTSALEEPAAPVVPQEIIEVVEAPVFEKKEENSTPPTSTAEKPKSYLSPLVKNIIKTEGITDAEIQQIKGTGENNRITKHDVLAFLDQRDQKVPPPAQAPVPSPPEISAVSAPVASATSDGDQVIEMSRMAQMISKHMTESKNTSVHVQSFVEADVTQLWEWREKVKNEFQQREGEKLTFTPIFMAAIIHALKAFPLLNSSLDGNRIIQKKNINIGMATALGDGNLIVPVIRNADHLNLVGLAKAVNDLSNRARQNQLRPEEVQQGTYTMTNIGNFGSITGTPIINQPQVGILALGVIRKMPAVIETPNGDFVGIRRKIILSHSYDHRIVNGAMGGNFVKHVADYLENWDTSITF